MSRVFGDFVRLSWPPAAAVAGAGLLLVLLSGSLRNAVVVGLILFIGVCGLYCFSGLSGVISFGHVAFMGVGGYVAGIMSMSDTLKQRSLPGLPGFVQDVVLSPPLAVLVGGLVAMVCALVLAGPLMRVSGLAAGLATFAMLAMFNVVAANWRGVTGGTSGLPGLPTRLDPIDLVPWALLAVVVTAALHASAIGLRLRASREGIVAARSAGVRVEAVRAVAFVVSAFLLGVSGALYGQHLGSFGPSTFYLGLTFTTLAMFVVGGSRSMWGPAAGAVVVTALQEALRALQNRLFDDPSGRPPQLAEVGLAVVLLAVLMLRPDGLVTGNRIRRPGGLPSLPSPGDPGPIDDTGAVDPDTGDELAMAPTPRTKETT